MIFEFFNPESEQQAIEIRRVDKALLSPCFLSGLSTKSLYEIAKSDFLLTTDFPSLPMRLDGHDQYYDKERDFENYTEILEEEAGRVQFCGVVSQEESSRIFTATTESFNKMTNILWNHINKKVLELGLKAEYGELSKKFCLEIKEVEWIYENCLLTVIHNDFYFILKAIVFGGLSNSALALRILEAYETGGIPGGWVGPLPEDDGKPEDCLQLFHFGGTS
ncbi:hypothetical protein [Algicola sagamiensis]|uniref:hypothetical protein n=1 Tax=Algicola sagamiensis TaxID=163869 RepID=UPI0003607268|nr:hypothetical protein [Algicola sagamiensis]